MKLKSLAVLAALHGLVMPVAAFAEADPPSVHQNAVAVPAATPTAPLPKSLKGWWQRTGTGAGNAFNVNIVSVDADGNFTGTLTAYGSRTTALSGMNDCHNIINQPVTGKYDGARLRIDVAGECKRTYNLRKGGDHLFIRGDEKTGVKLWLDPD
jgi:hypothetical protein